MSDKDEAKVVRDARWAKNICMFNVVVSVCLGVALLRVSTVVHERTNWVDAVEHKIGRVDKQIAELAETEREAQKMFAESIQFIKENIIKKDLRDDMYRSVRRTESLVEDLAERVEQLEQGPTL